MAYPASAAEAAADLSAAADLLGRVEGLGVQLGGRPREVGLPVEADRA